MNHWLELNNYVLTYPVDPTISEDGTLSFYLEGLSIGEMIHLRSRIEGGDPLVLCTDYQNGGPVVIEPLIYTTVRVAKCQRQIYTLEISTSLLRQNSPLLRFAVIPHQHHGTRFASD